MREEQIEKKQYVDVRNALLANKSDFSAVDLECQRKVVRTAYSRGSMKTYDIEHRKLSAMCSIHDANKFRASRGLSINSKTPYCP